MSTQSRRAALETPFAREHEESQALRMETGVMPKDLPGLLRWFEAQVEAELPARLHLHAVWRDRVTRAEAEEGVQPVGASDTGAPALAEPFRKQLENSPWETDQDGYYMRPVASAIARIGRRKPLLARHLTLLAAAGFDWRRRADALGWAHEEYELFITEVLIRLWREHRDRKLVLT